MQTPSPYSSPQHHADDTTEQYADHSAADESAIPGAAVDSGTQTMDAADEELRMIEKKEWDCVTLMAHPGRSMVYKHVVQVSLDPTKVDVYDEIMSDSKALQKVAEGGCWLCLLCRDDGQPLNKCIRKMKAGDTSNTTKHLNDAHNAKSLRHTPYPPPNIPIAEVKEESKPGPKRKTPRTPRAPSTRSIINEPTLTLSAARLLAERLEAEATLRNLRMVFAICDQHGNLKLFHRMDGTSAGSVKIAQSKAYTAASLPFSTKDLGERSGNLPGNPYGSVEGFLPLGGGLPIFNKDGVHMGGVGVSGATPELDEMVACAGIQLVNGIECTR